MKQHATRHEGTAYQPVDVGAEATGTRERSAWGLTEREEQVVELLGEGKSNKEIARGLRISLHTAKSHVSRVLHKLGVDSRTEAALLWQRWKR